MATGYTRARTATIVIAHLAAVCGLILTAAAWGGVTQGNKWDLLAVAYPPGRSVEVTLGGAEKSLTSKGVCKVKWEKKAASVELELEGLPDPAAAGWAGRQYVLWAVDKDSHAVNVGAVPTRGGEAKWEVSVPMRIFGLLITAESDPKASAPSEAVAMESLLPTNPTLVVPVFRIQVPLTFR